VFLCQFRATTQSKGIEEKNSRLSSHNSEMVLINSSHSPTKIKHMFLVSNVFKLQLRTKLTKWQRDQRTEKLELSLLTMR
jgi:hypothetical protein